MDWSLQSNGVQYTSNRIGLENKNNFWKAGLSTISIISFLENVISAVVLEVAVREVVRCMFNLPYFYLLAQWSRVLLERLTVSQLVKNFPPFCGTRRFITALTIPRHLS